MNSIILCGNPPARVIQRVASTFNLHPTTNWVPGEDSFLSQGQLYATNSEAAEIGGTYNGITVRERVLHWRLASELCDVVYAATFNKDGAAMIANLQSFFERSSLLEDLQELKELIGGKDD